MVNEAPKLGFTPGQFGARLVGRWQSGKLQALAMRCILQVLNDILGAPVQENPDHDDPSQARRNDFDYPVNDHRNCPFASHMRKTKPRALVDNMDKFDIMRRGIPYGPELGPDEELKTKQDRGLMFLCYQTSLSNGFQFIRNRESSLVSRRSFRSLTLDLRLDQCR